VLTIKQERFAQVTLDIYSHILPDMQKDAMTELDTLLAM